MNPPPLLSIIIPTSNEMNNAYFPRLLSVCTNISSSEVEVIVVDSKSDDGTSEFVSAYPVTLIKIKDQSRAQRLNHGVSAARGTVILLHHPRCLISNESLKYFLAYAKHLKPNQWGGFKLKFDDKHRLLTFIAWYSNTIRVKLKGIVYLDHCVFFHRNLKTAAFPLPDMDIFEDTLSSQRFLRCSRPCLLPYGSQASAIRFRTRGVIKHFCLNQLLKFMFKSGIKHSFMNRLYEHRCHLNIKPKKT